MARTPLAYFAPGRTMLIVSAMLILAGMALLALPVSRVQPIGALDLFFSAASAYCVTGMFTIPLTHFSTFGQCVILFLLQIGGISLITLTVMLASQFIRLGLGTSIKAKQFAEIEIGSGGLALLPFVALSTLCIELVGALCMLGIFSASNSWPRAIMLSCFQSISSFCNIGVSLFGYDLEKHANNMPLLCINAVLMFLGSLGFPTLRELYLFGKYQICTRPKGPWRFSLQGKIILYGSCIVVALGMFFLVLADLSPVLHGKSIMEQFVCLLFQTVSFRSAGYVLCHIGQLGIPVIIVMMILGFIGSSPGSTGSGVKIPVVAISVVAIKELLAGKTEVSLAGREIPYDQIIKSFVIIFLSIAWIAAMTFFLALVQPMMSFMELLVEIVSAFTNLGVSLGITEQLSPPGKIIVVITMIIGRIGSSAFILALAKKMVMGYKKQCRYPEERVQLE